MNNSNQTTFPHPTQNYATLKGRVNTFVWICYYKINVLYIRKSLDIVVLLGNNGQGEDISNQDDGRHYSATTTTTTVDTATTGATRTTSTA